MKKQLFLLALISGNGILLGQEETLNQDFETYDPVSTLVVPENPTCRAKFPFIDVHNHQRSMMEEDLSGLVGDMDSLNMEKI